MIDLKTLHLGDLCRIRDSLQQLAEYGLADNDLLVEVCAEIERRAK